MTAIRSRLTWKLANFVHESKGLFFFLIVFFFASHSLPPLPPLSLIPLPPFLLVVVVDQNEKSGQKKEKEDKASGRLLCFFLFFECGQVRAFCVFLYPGAEAGVQLRGEVGLVVSFLKNIFF